MASAEALLSPGRNRPGFEVSVKPGLAQVSAVPFTKLFSEELWQELATDAGGFTREMERQVSDGSEPQVGSEKKPFGRRYAGRGLTLDSPWLRLGASSRMLDIVNS